MAKRKEKLKKQIKSIKPIEINQTKSVKQNPKIVMPESKQEFSEIYGIVFFLLAIFVFLAGQFPSSTGVIGYWTIQVGAYNLIGDGSRFLALFLLFPAITLVVSKSRRRLVFFTSIYALISFSIFIEYMERGTTTLLSWPIPTGGGGIIGFLGVYVIYKLLGIYGVKLFLFGSITISSILILNISLRDLFKAIYKSFTTTVPIDEQQTQRYMSETQSDSFLKELKYGLFYTEKTPENLSRQSINSTSHNKHDIGQAVKSYLANFDLSPSDTSKLVSNNGISKIEKETPITFQNNTISEVIEEPEVIEIEPLVAVQKEEIIEKNIEQDEEEEASFTINEVKKSSKYLVDFKKENSNEEYKFPPISLLNKSGEVNRFSKENLKVHQERARLLETTLASFNVDAKVINITPGPSVTRYELQPGIGVKISKITNLANDLALKLAASDVRIEAPIPGKALVGIEVPNPTVDTISLRLILETTDFYQRESKLCAALGLTITGESILLDITKMPHLLIAGATGSGKSVCVNSLILSILMKSTPEDVKFLMIDPKKVELSLYEGIPHLVAPVVTDPHKAAATLKRWALVEMENRYETFSKVGVKNIEGYNDRIKEMQELQVKDPEKARKEIEAFYNLPEDQIEELEIKKLPYIVVIIDELADLMMVAAAEVETTICRLAQMARATGIHLVIATQRPSVNVITGLIKANVPSRISFYLQSQIDSRTVLDMGGAEKLLGKGDMLYSPVGSFKPTRIQGVYLSEKEIKAVVSFLKKQAKPIYLNEIIDIEPLEEASKKGSSTNSDPDQDDLYEQAKEIVMTTQYASTSYLQRKLRIGYNRAARIMDELKENGVLINATASKPMGQG